ncbi:MAG TPA: DUF3473 domain-containing protein [Geminicoccaceae bacterium]|nr:DUF3473 domain-containing protein [Geminicoccus sp.]HMU51230.1 DUF3473 domain-containing protein [Geminicoccaceae bacterium]
MTHRILEFLGERGVQATFFVVGDITRRTPQLIQRIAAGGHEIASHSWRHVALTQEDPAVFRRAVADDRRRLEDLAGAPVLGFRAPLFSLTPASAWAIDAIADAGFGYSSSIVPARTFGHHWAGAPTAPFRWPNGIVELPCPVGRVALFTMPFLGGMYLRYLPPWRLRQASRGRAEGCLWTYCHPYDFDTEEPFRRLPGQRTATSLFLWWNRGSILHRLDLILRGRRAMTFAELRPTLGQLATYDPAAGRAVSAAATGAIAGPPA